MILVTCECNYTRNEGGDVGGWRGDQHLQTQCLREGGGMGRGVEVTGGMVCCAK